MIRCHTVLTRLRLQILGRLVTLMLKLYNDCKAIEGGHTGIYAGFQGYKDRPRSNTYIDLHI